VRKEVEQMFPRLLPVTVLLLVTLIPVQLAYEREPMITPRDIMVTKAASQLNNQGVDFYLKGRLEEALGSFIMASEADPTFAVAHYNCAVVLTTRGFKGDFEEAVRHLEWSYNLDPRNEEIREFLMELVTLLPMRA
jgi:tetratricopeptide (TPR) repeat protein